MGCFSVSDNHGQTSNVIWLKTAFDYLAGGGK